MQRWCRPASSPGRRWSPAGVADSTSAQFSAGATNNGPRILRGDHLLVDPPIGPTAPAPVIVPVPATGRPRADRRGELCRPFRRPASDRHWGPPMLSRPTSTVKSEVYCSSTRIPMTGPLRLVGVRGGGDRHQHRLAVTLDPQLETGTHGLFSLIVSLIWDRRFTCSPSMLRMASPATSCPSDAPREPPEARSPRMSPAGPDGRRRPQRRRLRLVEDRLVHLPLARVAGFSSGSTEVSVANRPASALPTFMGPAEPPVSDTVVISRIPVVGYDRVPDTVSTGLPSTSPRMSNTGPGARATKGIGTRTAAATSNTIGIDAAITQDRPARSWTGSQAP